MQATYRLQPNELTESFFAMLKNHFGNREITVSVATAMDETILSTEANRRHLSAAPAAARRGKRTPTFDELADIGKKTPVFGCAKGRFKMADDFDAPLTEFREYM